MFMKLYLVINLLFVKLNLVLSLDSCTKTITQTYIKPLCANQTIFEENFDDFNDEKWKHTIRISSIEEEEFVVYNKKQKNVYVKDGKLFILPTLLSDDTVNNGEIDLKFCTGRYHTSDCFLKSTSFNILPPIESAQISMKDFHFKYGIVEIRAKLPTGDWIYPQMWLEPKFNEYGQLFNSGRINIATAHGNKKLNTADGIDISNKLLKCGIIVGIDEKIFAKSALYLSGRDWSNNFHTFKFIWKPDSLEFIVDGISKILYSQAYTPLTKQFKYTDTERALWPDSSLLAPFDKQFYLTLGLAVGGKREFPDHCKTIHDHKKPWKNIGSIKRLLNFWLDKDNWYTTWNNEESALQVDYVKITSL